MVRVARWPDLEAIMGLYRQLHPGDPVPAADLAEAAFAAILATDGLDLLVLEDAGLVVATSYLNVIQNITRSVSSYAVIENVVVDAAVRGTGLGKRLMAGTLDAAWAAGCYKAMLMTGSRNPATHAFYRSCGFNGTEKAAYVAHPS